MKRFLLSAASVCALCLSALATTELPQTIDGAQRNKLFEYISAPTITGGTIDGATIGDLKIEKVLYVDGNRTDTYTADGGLSRPYKTVLAALAVVNADVGKSWIINVAEGTYSDNLTITGPRFLRIVGCGGVTLSGTILINSGVGSYDRIEFVGTEGGRSEKGPALTISGKITGTRTNDSLIYVSFKGCLISGQFEATTCGTWVLQYLQCRVNGAITGTFNGTDPEETILVEAHGFNEFAGAITGKTSLYNCNGADFYGTINTTPWYENRFKDCTFAGAITIAPQGGAASTLVYVDATSYKSFLARTPTLTGATYSHLQGTMAIQDASAVAITGGTITNATITGGTVDATSVKVGGVDVSTAVVGSLGLQNSNAVAISGGAISGTTVSGYLVTAATNGLWNTGDGQSYVAGATNAIVSITNGFATVVYADGKIPYTATNGATDGQYLKFTAGGTLSFDTVSAGGGDVYLGTNNTFVTGQTNFLAAARFVSLAPNHAGVSNLLIGNSIVGATVTPTNFIVLGDGIMPNLVRITEYSAGAGAIVMGSAALATATNVSDVVVIGNKAATAASKLCGTSSGGYGSTIIGNGAAKSAGTIGAYNTIIGDNACWQISAVGDANTIIGAYAGNGEAKVNTVIIGAGSSPGYGGKAGVYIGSEVIEAAKGTFVNSVVVGRSAVGGNGYAYTNVCMLGDAVAFPSASINNAFLFGKTGQGYRYLFNTNAPSAATGGMDLYGYANLNGATKVGEAGTAITDIKTVTLATNFGVVAAGAVTSIPIPLAGAKVNDAVALRLPEAIPIATGSNLVFSGLCTNDVLIIRAYNPSATLGVDASAELTYGATVITY